MVVVAVSPRLVTSLVVPGVSSRLVTSLVVLRGPAMMVLLGLLLFVSMPTAAKAQEKESMPVFLESIPNKTVVVGREVILPCSVDNLKGYKVAWIFVETQTILTIHHTIITKNPRFSLARNDHKHWYLKISDVKPTDRGSYMCQVNSDPMMSQTGFLDVQVPPDIIDEESSSEVVVQEGHDVTLRCRARGSPKPIISWKREDGGKIHLSNGINLKVTDSEVLHIPKVSRLHMGAYLCIASNDVPPSVSKRIVLQVQFAPVLWIPNQLVGISQGSDVTLECHTEAFPRSVNYWNDANNSMILSSGRFDAIVAENGYRAYMRLKIKSVQKSDYGTYGCTAKNSYGETSGTVKVYEIPRPIMMPEHREIEDKKPTEETHTKKKDDRRRTNSSQRPGSRQRWGEDDNNFDESENVSTVTPDGVIVFDAKKLWGKNKRKDKIEEQYRQPTFSPPHSSSSSRLIAPFSHLFMLLMATVIIQLMMLSNATF